MNYPHLSAAQARFARAKTKRLEALTDKTAPFGPMAAIKGLNFLALTAAALALSERDQWRMLGGLLIGCVFGGLGGMLMVALKTKRLPWEVYAARFVLNLCFGVGGGALAMLYLVSHYGMTTGPLLTIGVGFLCSCFGVAVASVLTPVLMKRLRKIAGSADEEESKEDVIGLQKPGPPADYPTERNNRM